MILTTLKIVPIFEAVYIPMVSSLISDGNFLATPLQEQAATLLLDELFRWAKALKPLRS